MRSTFWLNCICERQSCQNRHTGLKSSSKRAKSALFMKIVQNARFRSCAGGFAQIVFFRVKLLKIARLVSNSLQNGKTVRFSWKLYKTLFSGHAQHVLAKSHFKASKLSKSSHWPGILSKTGKQCAFHKNCTKRAFQVMRSTFWPKRIFKRQSCQNRHTGLKILSKTGKQCAFHENCTKRSFQVMRSTFWPNCICERQSCQKHVLAKLHLWASKLSKSSHWPQILSKTMKQCAFHKNCTKRAFQVMRSTFWPNRIFKRQSCQNRHTGLKFSPKRGKSALFMKIVQNARFRSYAAGFGQIAFLRVKVVKIVTLAWKARQNGEKGCAFYENCTKRSFQVMRSTFWPNRILERQSCQNRHTGLKFSPKRGNSAVFMKIVQNARFRSYAARFGQIAFLRVKVVKIVTLAWKARQNGKRVRFL